MSKSPAFQFYPADFLSDGNQMVMELEEVGAYIRLLCVCWHEGHLPTDLRKLAKMCGATAKQMEAMWPALSPCFEAHPVAQGLLIHPRLDRERQKQSQYSAKMREAGKKSGERRRNLGSTKAQQDGQLESNSSVCSLQSSVKDTSTAAGRYVENPEYTTPALALEAHKVLGMGLWGDELSRKFTETKNFIRRTWEASGITSGQIYAAIHGLRIMVERGDVEWLVDRKGKPLDGIHVLAKQAVVPGPDGTQLRSLFDAATQAYHTHEQQNARGRTTGPQRLAVNLEGPGLVA